MPGLFRNLAERGDGREDEMASRKTASDSGYGRLLIVRFLRNEVVGTSVPLMGMRMLDPRLLLFYN